MCPSCRPAWAAMSLYSPASFRRLCGPLGACRRHFCARFQQSGAGLKTKTSVKAIYRPVTAFRALVAIPIFPHRKTAHRSCQRPAQGIKQPRPAPPGASRGIIICSGPGIAPRNAPPFGHTRHSGSRGSIPWVAHHQHPACPQGQPMRRTASAGTVL